MTAAESRRRFATARLAHLATVRPDGTPHIVPIAFALLGETIYSVVDQKPKRTTDLQRLANVRANPHASVLVDHYDEDWSRLWWARADGTARALDPDEPEARRSVAALTERYPQQRPAGQVLAIDVDRWTGWLGGGGDGASE